MERLKKILMILICNLLVCSGYTQTIKVANTWTRSGAPKGYYKWTVYLDTDTSTCKTISYVEYYLHNTFKQPVVKVSNTHWKKKFPYSATGWGEFNIRAKIVFRDPRKKHQYVNYWLKLGRV